MRKECHNDTRVLVAFYGNTTTAPRHHCDVAGLAYNRQGEFGISPRGVTLLALASFIIPLGDVSPPCRGHDVNAVDMHLMRHGLCGKRA